MSNPLYNMKLLLSRGNEKKIEVANNFLKWIDKGRKLIYNEDVENAYMKWR